MYPDFTCYSLFSCFTITLDQTFKNNGGFGLFMEQIYTTDEENESTSYNIGRLFFDQLSNFVLLILIVQILAGLIIDKFGQMREASENMEEELKSNCIICGEKGDNIERKTGETFEYHKEYMHNLWNYILFIGYLRCKPKEDYNGIDTCVNKLFKKEDLGWLPYSLSREKEDDDEYNEVNTKLNEIEGSLQGPTDSKLE